MAKPRREKNEPYVARHCRVRHNGVEEDYRVGEPWRRCQEHKARTEWDLVSLLYTSPNLKLPRRNNDDHVSHGAAAW
jgi:hypothetical protein